MRYAHGIMFGAMLPGVIFLGSMVISVTGYGADAVVLAALWDIYVIWFLTSIALLILPLVLVYFVRRDMFKEFIIFEAGGMGIFAPLWLALTTDMSGVSFTTLFTQGVVGGIVGFGPSGTIEPIDVSNIVLVPLLAASVIFGVYILRPSFLARYSGRTELPELTALKKSATSPEEELDAEMPGVAPPVATPDTVADLRDLLVELSTPEPTITVILSSGIATVPDLVSTSAEQLASIAGMDRRSAEALLIAAQKKLWFGDI
ncbi:MAG: helix-hairpin-helix domain-containing protein [Candidatus Thorarchaeota archaeon]|nr:MAG: hypothetical protein DRP09_01690 [Candidatus Thorarchaeota archaeon]RLI59039.1 MAG: hypothetical protein DRO87_04080 [Candidatus Thorarchaeota archaeon]